MQKQSKVANSVPQLRDVLSYHVQQEVNCSEGPVEPMAISVRDRIRSLEVSNMVSY